MLQSVSVDNDFQRMIDYGWLVTVLIPAQERTLCLLFDFLLPMCHIVINHMQLLIYIKWCSTPLSYLANVNASYLNNHIH